MNPLLTLLVLAGAGAAAGAVIAKGFTPGTLADESYVPPDDTASGGGASPPPIGDGSGGVLDVGSLYDHVTPGSQPSRADTYSANGGFSGYIQWLQANYLERQPWLKDTYNREAIRQATIAAGRKIGFNLQLVQLLWGIVNNEASATPTGVYGTGWASDPVQLAIGANSTAYGIGGVTITGFLDISGKTMDCNHWDLWLPPLAIQASGLIFAYNLRVHGNDIQAALAGYGGNAKTGAKEYAAYQKYRAEIQSA